MRLSRSSLLLWLVVALLVVLVWLTVTGRLGESRHGYAAVQRRQASPVQPAGPLRITCGTSLQSLATAFG